MMESYVKVFRSIWQDPDFLVLPGAVQRTYLMLISQPGLSRCGLLPFTPGRWGRLASDTTVKSVRRDIEVLTVAVTLPPTLEEGVSRTVQPFLLLDEGTEELLVRSYQKYDEGFKIPNVRKALFRSIEGVLSGPLRHAAATLCQTLCQTIDVTVPENLGYLLEPLTYKPLTYKPLPTTSNPDFVGTVQRVFDAWVESLGGKRRVLDPKRRRAIVDALKAFPADDVLDAVRGWVYDPWPDRPLHNDITILLKDATHIEKFRDLWRNGPPMGRPNLRNGERALAHILAGGEPIDTTGELL